MGKINKRLGESINYISHPSFIKRGLTAEQRKAGDISELKAVRIDDRTTIYIQPEQDEHAVVERWHKRQNECKNIINGKPLTSPE